MELHYTIREMKAGKHPYSAEVYAYWIILDGSGQISDKTSTIVFTTYDVLEVPPGHRYTLLCDSTLQLGVIDIQDFISPNELLQKKDHTDTELIRRVFFFALEFHGFHHQAMPMLMYHVNKLMYETLSKTGLQEYRMNPQIADVCVELNAHYLDSGYDINELIAKSGYSKSHFHKLFREATGKTPTGYIQQKRIDRAIYLLGQNPRPSVTAVASACGFADAHYFSRIFKKITGKSPSDS